MTTFDVVRNLAGSTLGSPRALGATSFTLSTGGGALFGDGFPVLFAASPASNFDSAGRILDRTLVAYYRAAGRAGDTLTGCSLVEGTDRALAAGDVVAIHVAAQHLAQLQQAVAALEAAPPEHDHDDRYYTEAEAAALLTDHLAEADPHPQYLTEAEGDARYDAAGAAVGAIVAHEAQGDPHPQYQTAAESAATADARIAAAVGVTVAALAHGHAIADVSGLQAALDGKAAAGHAHSAADITSGTVATARGGLGVALADPDADRILFWDDSAGAHAYLMTGSGLSITGTTLSVSASGIAIGSAISGGGANRVLYQDGSQNLASSANLTYASGTFTIKSPGAQVVFAIPRPGDSLNTFSVTDNGFGGCIVQIAVSTGTITTWNGPIVIAPGMAGGGAHSTSVRPFNGTVPVLLVQGVTSQTAQLLGFQGRSSTTDFVDQAAVTSYWQDATHASRKGGMRRYAADSSSGTFPAGWRETAREWSDGASGRVATSAPASAPADADLANGMVSLWMDESGHNLKVKVRYSDGTVKTGTVALT